MISLTGVTKLYNGKRQVAALESIDLEIARGEMVSIVGPSGSGKSTLLNLIGGLDRPTSGEIRIDGQSVADLSDDDLTRLRRDKIGFIFQFFNLLPSLSCVENVALPLHLKGLGRQEIDHRARQLARTRATRPAASITCPTNSPAASASASPSPAPSPSRPPSCSPMSPPATSTLTPAPRSSPSSATSTSASAPPS